MITLSPPIFGRRFFLGCLLIVLVVAAPVPAICPWLVPINVADRHSWQYVRLTAIGPFGAPRKERPTVPAHLHTAVDLRRPSKNYQDEPVFAASCGRVISMRDDGPFSQIIIEHAGTGAKVWSVYEHVAGIRVHANDSVYTQFPIARFMNRRELDRYGWKFDHLHFEIMKIAPRRIKPYPDQPGCRFSTYNLECYTSDDLEKMYWNPESFLKERWQDE
jgi:murein DD-endopeptidase MepM/ murein hydrolase activator NlpD